MDEVEILRDALANLSHPALILAARHVVSSHADAPDWVRVLAGGNMENSSAVVSEARVWLAAEDEYDYTCA